MHCRGGGTTYTPEGGVPAEKGDSAEGCATPAGEDRTDTACLINANKDEQAESGDGFTDKPFGIPSDFWGFGNYDGSDGAHCPTVFMGSIENTDYEMFRNYMYTNDMSVRP